MEECKQIREGVYESQDEPRVVDDARISEIFNRLVPKQWRDVSVDLQIQAEEFLRQSGIRDVVLRHEGRVDEQRFSHVLAFFAANATVPK